LGGGGVDNRLRGRTFEDLVEYYFSLRGFTYSRNARVRGASGALHEVDILLHTSEGRVVVEVKNLARPAPKEVVMKAFEVARDIGASGAVVVSASGFTEGARRVAGSLGVELLTLEDILSYLEAAEVGGRAAFLAWRAGWESLDGEAGRRSRRRLLFLRVERPERLGCIYAPFYYLEARAVLPGDTPRYLDVDAVFSAVTGLPLAARGGGLREAARGSSLLPPEVMDEYRILAGSRVSRRDYVARRGERAWRLLERSLRRAGLLEVVSSRPKVVAVLDDRGSLGELEEAAALFLAPKAGGPGGCRLVEPRYSPGAVASLAGRLYGFRVRGVRSLYAPLAAYRLVARDGSYRLLLLAAWTSRPRVFEPADPEAYAEPLLG
jgi:hypothetical protein